MGVTCVIHSLSAAIQTRLMCRRHVGLVRVGLNIDIDNYLGNSITLVFNGQTWFKWLLKYYDRIQIKFILHLP